MRLAWREIRAGGRRSWLVVSLIAVPVALASLLMTLALATVVTPEQDAESRFGQFPAQLTSLEGADGICVQSDLAQASCGHSAGILDSGLHVDLARYASDGVASEMEHEVPAIIDGVRVSVIVQTLDAVDPRYEGRVRQAVAVGSSEVAAAKGFLDLFGVALGDSITVEGKEYRIATDVKLAPLLSGRQLIVPPGHPLSGGRVSAVYLDKIPDSKRIAALNHEGIGVITREAVMAAFDDRPEMQMSAMVLVAQVVLSGITGSIVGAAFSITLRHRQRGWALLRATGASSTTMRRIVWSIGMLLGGVGVLAGAILGLAAGAGFVLLADLLGWQQSWGIRLGWWQTLVISLGGWLIAILSIWLPARTVLKQDPLASLRVSQVPVGAPRRPWLWIPLALGAVTCSTFVFVLARAGSASSYYDPRLSAAMVLAIPAGALIYLAGLNVVGWILHGAAPRASGLPLAARMALRDADRHRTRTLGLVAAVTSVSALAIAPVFLVGLNISNELVTYRSQSRPEWVTMSVMEKNPHNPQQAAPDFTAQIEVVSRLLGQPVRVVTLAAIGNVMIADDDVCRSQRLSDADQCPYGYSGNIIADDGQYLDLVLGASSGSAKAALAEGKAVVFQPAAARDGKLHVLPAGTDQPAFDQAPQVPAFAAALESGVSSVISRATAEQIGLRIVPNQVVLQYEKPPAEKALLAAQMELARRGLDTHLAFDLGLRSWQRDFLPWLCVGSVVAVVVVAGLCVALSIRDGAETRSALANLGATRRHLRSVTRLHALFSVGLGAVLGAAAALVPLVTYAAAAGSHFDHLPWGYIVVSVVAPVPAVMVLAGSLTRPAPARVIRQD